MAAALDFFVDWIRSPLRTGAVLPSGTALSDAMAAAMGPVDGHGVVVELGAGTGVVTHSLVARGVSESRLVAVEMNDRFCERLQSDFPLAHIAKEDAYDITGLVSRHNLGTLDAVVSSLPLLTRKPEDRIRLLHACLSVMKPGAPLVQFTYQNTSPIPVDDPAILVTRAARVWLNVPPATVWTYRLKTTA